MKHAFILGTRPEIIKLFPVIRAHLERGLPFSIIHTNQHYSPQMDAVFFQQLEIPAPQFNLNVGSSARSTQLGRVLETIEPVLAQFDANVASTLQLGKMLEALEPVLKDLEPDLVFVQGDTNSVLAGALAASLLGIPVAHIEAGLRSYDHRMPEEFIRTHVDHIAEYLFAPTDKAREILLGEGFPASKIHVTGNTVVDTLLHVAGLCEKLEPLESRWNLKTGNYLLVTLHRPENVDSKVILSQILEAIAEFSSRHGLPAVFPVHPRTARLLKEFGIGLPDCFRRLEPVDYLSFVQLEKEARLIITDSGGVQEEACVLRVPCVTARLSTERPETVEAGANLVTGVEKQRIVEGAEKMLACRADWTNPFGDGRAGERIVEIILESQTGQGRLQ